MFMHIPRDCAWVTGPCRGVNSYLPTFIRQTSYGTVRLVWSDLRSPPAIDLRFFDPADFAPMRAGGRFAMRTPDGFCKPGYPLEDLAMPVRMSYENIDTLVWRMGAEPRKERPSVVDAELRVHGAWGLRVCVASVFPEIIGSPTMTLTVMVAKKCAYMINLKASWSRRGFSATEL